MVVVELEDELVVDVVPLKQINIYSQYPHINYE